MCPWQWLEYCYCYSSGQYNHGNRQEQPVSGDRRCWWTVEGLGDHRVCYTCCRLHSHWTSTYVTLVTPYAHLKWCLKSRKTSQEKCVMNILKINRLYKHIKLNSSRINDSNLLAFKLRLKKIPSVHMTCNLTKLLFTVFSGKHVYKSSKLCGEQTWSCLHTLKIVSPDMHKKSSTLTIQLVFCSWII